MAAATALHKSHHLWLGAPGLAGSPQLPALGHPRGRGARRGPGARPGAARRRTRRRRAPPRAEEESLTHVVAAAAATGSWELKLVMLVLRRKASLPIPQAGGHQTGQARTLETRRSEGPSRPTLVRPRARAEPRVRKERTHLTRARRAARPRARLAPPPPNQALGQIPHLHRPRRLL